MNFEILLAIFLVLIIISLAFYAGLLLTKINRQKIISKQLAQQKASEKAVKKQKRNKNICESIRFIARATAQEQCNVSEAAIRLTVLLETLVVDKAIDLEKNYPAISEMYHNIKEMPTHDKRKKIAVKKLKELDMQRQVFEAELASAIFKEASQLETFSL